MSLINISQPPKYYEADEELVRRALRGRTGPNGLARCIRSHVVRYEEIVETTEMVNNISHIVHKKVRKQERYYPDHKSRVNWGCLYRACRRLVDCGVMTSFTLRHNGDLDVVWFTPRKKTESKRIVKHVPAPVASTIGVAERMLDKRLEYDHGEMYLKRDTTPKQYFESHPEPLEVKVPFEDLGKAQQDRLVAEHGGVQNVPFDLFRIDNMADRVAFRKCQYMRMLHTEKAVQERVQENKAKHTPAYLMNYNSKIKYSSFTGTAHQDIRPLHAKIAELREEKGCCAWPNGYNKTV